MLPNPSRLRPSVALDNGEAGALRLSVQPTGFEAGNVQVVRFALEGDALPPVSDTLRLGELARRAAMARYGRRNEERASAALSGKDASGRPLQGHLHAFYLPTDEDGDGRLDHLTVFAQGGLCVEELVSLADIDALSASGSRPVRLSCRGHGAVEEFREESPIFRASRRWRSLTPYVLPRHVKFRGERDGNGRRSMVDSPEEQIRREIATRWPNGPSLSSVELQDYRREIAPMVEGESLGCLPFDFVRHRTRGSNGGGAFNFELRFSGPVPGPVVLGFACHYGLGIFVPAQS